MDNVQTEIPTGNVQLEKMYSSYLIECMQQILTSKIATFCQLKTKSLSIEQVIFCTHSHVDTIFLVSIKKKKTLRKTKANIIHHTLFFSFSVIWAVFCKQPKILNLNISQVWTWKEKCIYISVGKRYLVFWSLWCGNKSFPPQIRLLSSRCSISSLPLPSSLFPHDNTLLALPSYYLTAFYQVVL